jgi:hypothetical protein
MPIIDDEPRPQPASNDLSGILNLLQGDSKQSSGLDMQSIMLKMLMSGGLNNLFASKQAPESIPKQPPAPPRTINLENYRRVD